MKSKTKFTLTVTAMVAVTLLAIVGIMAAFAATQQTFSTSITVVYKSTNVEGTASAQWKLGSYTDYGDGTGYWSFYENEWQDMDSNGTLAGGQTELDLSADGSLSLSPAQSIELSDEYPAVVLKYTFTNSATHPYTLNFKYQQTTATNNINTFYAASSQEMDDGSLGNINNNFANMLETTVLGGTGENIYILLKIDNLGSDSSFDGTFNIKLDGLSSDYAEDFVYLYDGTSTMISGSAHPEATTLDTTGLTYNDEPVTKIGASAFQNNKNLQTVVLNDIEEIGAYAFGGCSEMTSLTIGESVTYIGRDAFVNLTNLTTLNYNAINTVLGSNSNGLFNSLGYECNGTAVTIGDKVTHIPSKLFSIAGGSESWYPRLSSLILGENLESVGDSAFYCYILFDRLTIPYKLSSIGTDAFQAHNNHSFDSIIVDSRNVKYSSRDINGNEHNIIIDTDTKTLIQGCNSSTIPSDKSVTSIGDAAFRYCTSLSEITIPENITSIGNSAFRGCGSLTELTIPESVKEIGMFAFLDITSINTINYYAENVVDLNGKDGGGDSDTVFGYSGLHDGIDIVLTIGENVKHIPAYLFRGYYGSGYPCKTVIINSADVYKELTGKGSRVAGDLLGCIEGNDNQGVLKVKTDIVDGNDMPEYLQTNYTKGVAVEGYYTFTKNAA